MNGNCCSVWIKITAPLPLHLSNVLQVPHLPKFHMCSCVEEQEPFRPSLSLWLRILLSNRRRNNGECSTTCSQRIGASHDPGEIDRSRVDVDMRDCSRVLVSNVHLVCRCSRLIYSRAFPLFTASSAVRGHGQGSGTLRLLTMCGQPRPVCGWIC